MSNTILIVEDDPNVVRLVSLYLKADGFQVISANDGAEGVKLALKEHPSLIVLDIMLPGMDGMEVCRTVRQESTVPIVMLTARVEEKDVLGGLDMGADDHVTKPFSPRQLAARVKAVLRRVFKAGSSDDARLEVRRLKRRRQGSSGSAVRQAARSSAKWQV